MTIIGDAETCLTVTPPHRSDGIAEILVALGSAGIAVNRVGRGPDDTGEYLMAVTGDVDVAVRILRGIGCHASTSRSLEGRVHGRRRERRGLPDRRATSEIKAASATP